MFSSDKSRSEEDGKEDSPPRKIAGLHKMGIGGNILAEMKKKQEKRTSFLPKVCRINVYGHCISKIEIYLAIFFFMNKIFSYRFIYLSINPAHISLEGRIAKTSV